MKAEEDCVVEERSRRAEAQGGGAVGSGRAVRRRRQVAACWRYWKEDVQLMCFHCIIKWKNRPKRSVKSDNNWVSGCM
jgi:hypothetical protein